MKRVLVTCPPMLRMIDELRAGIEERGLRLQIPEVVQTLSETQLETLLPEVDGWIIGDDPATRRVLLAGKRGRLRAMVKWGVGVDNVDFSAAKELGIPVTNTPGMFGREVADLAMSYITALARETFAIDRGVRAGLWPKPAGISLQGRVLAIVGYGDIGRQLARRALAADMQVIAYDPIFQPAPELAAVRHASWPQGSESWDFLALTCALTQDNRHVINSQLFMRAKPGLRVVNVARGPLIDEHALVQALAEDRVHSAALDVMEEEPLPMHSALRNFERCIFGSHNASNTVEAVRATSLRAVDLLCDFLRNPA